jgi:hypothetical protein
MSSGTSVLPGICLGWLCLRCQLVGVHHHVLAPPTALCCAARYHRDPPPRPFCFYTCSMGVAAAAELIAALAFSGDRWRAQLLAKGFLQVCVTMSYRPIQGVFNAHEACRQMSSSSPGAGPQMSEGIYTNAESFLGSAGFVGSSEGAAVAPAGKGHGEAGLPVSANPSHAPVICTPVATTIGPAEDFGATGSSVMCTPELSASSRTLKPVP